MDDRQLKKALTEIDIPAADENAKKRALNLALAEFDEAQKKTAKTFQGFSFLSRLMGNSSKDTRREPMNKRLVYGGMMTALSLILVTGIVMQTQSPQTALQSTVRGAQDVAEPPGGEISKAYRAEHNIARNDHPMHQGAAPTVPLADMEKKDTGRGSQPERPAFAKVERSRTEGEADMLAAAPPIAQAAPAESRAMMAPGAAGGSMPYPVVADAIAPDFYQDTGRDKFEDFDENRVKTVSAEPVSTFSVDVDTSSYSFIRRQLNAGVLPQKDAVRVEEMINYFDYDYKLPETKEQPFAASVEIIPSPWKEGNQLLHIGIRGYDIEAAEKPRSNLVFLVDVSGSMNSPDKLPLLVNSMKLLLDTLAPEDTVAIVTYAGSAGTVLEPTKAADKTKILQALDGLGAGGSTAGAEGIRQAYQLAESSFDEQSVNRVILATDGDFNVGITNPEELQDFVERKRETGIFLSVLGFGEGNYNDQMMQTLAQNGNGVAAYIDSLNEARKVLVEEASGALFPIAKDVKIQVEFNPATVAEYRLVGYETRHLNREDFNNDAVDAGDIGAGHTVTAIYEITPVGGPRVADDNRYAAIRDPKANSEFSDEYAFLKIRYKLPDGEGSKLITRPIVDADQAGIIPEGQDCSYAPDCDPYNFIGDDTLFATAVASFGQMLKGGKYTGGMTYNDVIQMAQQAKGDDEFGYRAEFINLVRLAKSAAALQKN